VLPEDLVQSLRTGLVGLRPYRSLSPDALESIRKMCVAARKNGWTAEQLIVAVKDACYAAPEITSITTTSEREALLASIVTGCIQEYFRGHPDQ
jgi:hypothetical protein